MVCKFSKFKKFPKYSGWTHSIFEIYIKFWFEWSTNVIPGSPSILLEYWGPRKINSALNLFSNNGGTEKTYLCIKNP